MTPRLRERDTVTRAFHVTTTIDRPVDAAWAALTDWARASEWMPGVDAVHPSGETAVGTSLVVHARGKDRTSSITALEPGRSVTLTSAQGSVTAHYTYTCEPDGASTTVSLAADVLVSGPWRLIGPLIRMAIRGADGRQLEGFKQAVEAKGRHV